MNPPFKKYDDLNPLYPSVLCAKHVCNWPSDSREDFLKSQSILPCILLSLNKLKSPHTRMLSAKFGLNWINGSGEGHKSLQTDGYLDRLHVIRIAHVHRVFSSVEQKTLFPTTKNNHYIVFLHLL